VELADGTQPHGGLIFQFVGKHTDKEVLQLQINHGLVWVQEKYG
jgi:hypothetical protein